MGEALEAHPGPPSQAGSPAEVSPRLTPGPWTTPTSLPPGLGLGDLQALVRSAQAHGAVPEAPMGGWTLAWEPEPQTKQGAPPPTREVQK